MNRADVYQVIDAERDYQDQKWGPLPERPHEVGAWVLIMENLLAKARASWASDASDHAALDELRKVVTVGVACFEQHGVPERGRGFSGGDPPTPPRGRPSVPPMA